MGADEALLRLVAGIARYWRNRGFHYEADTWQPLALERAAEPLHARMHVLHADWGRANLRGDLERADALVAEWRRIAEQIGDEHQVLRAMNSTASTAEERGQWEEARAQFMAIRERAQTVRDSDMVAIATVNLAPVVLRFGDFDAALAYATEALEHFREKGDDTGVAVALEKCGWAALGQSDSVRAEGFFREGLTMCGRVGWLHAAAVAAVGVGAALIARHEEERGALFFGAAAALREELALGSGFFDEPTEERHDEALANAKAALGEEAFAAAWARGQAMSVDELVAFAGTE